jgi:glycosyltransferase involved in cell wall biosynthesis
MLRDARRLSIGYVIGALGRGGAELQLLQLAAGLVDRGHSVQVIAYDGPSVLDEAFRRAGVQVHYGQATRRRAKLRTVRSWLQAHAFDVVHGILERPSSVALLARWPRTRPSIVATDYSSATYLPRTLFLWSYLATYHLADCVVTEVETNRASINRLAPWLRHKTRVIRNGLDTKRFRPKQLPSAERGVFEFCAVSTLSAVKNPLRVIDAVDVLRQRGHERFRLVWYGRDAPDASKDVGPQARARAIALGLENHVIFMGDTEEIEAAYQRADALVHASSQEGFPNAVAEALACGLPVAVGFVSDLPQVVKEATNGVVFDETSADSIADALETLLVCPPQALADMGSRSRELAIRWFDLDRFIQEHEVLYRSLTPDATGR